LPPSPKLRDEIVAIVKDALAEALPREWMDTDQAARYIGCSPQHLEIGRAKGNKGLPPFSKHGRLVRYRRADIDAWLETAKVAHDALSGAA
jgi:Helix-turn-helix domain